MTSITYILGAGVNRCLSDSTGLRPPLTRDFFQQALKYPSFQGERHTQELKPLFDYIESFWHRSAQQLRDEPFDLEEALLQLGFPPTRGDELLAPIVITPVLNKRLTTFPIISEVWSLAAQELRSCKRLVVVGYSFPPTDFHVRRLLREAFLERTPDELVVVNPDTSTIHVAKDLCNFRGPVVACESLEEFVGKTTVSPS